MTNDESLELPDIVLDDVSWSTESWDYGQRAGISCEVHTAAGQSLLRHAVGWSNYEQLTPPRYERREVVFEVRDNPEDPSSPIRYVTQEVDIVVDPGIVRPHSKEELLTRMEQGREDLILWLRYVAAAARLLEPHDSELRKLRNGSTGSEAQDGK